MNRLNNTTPAFAAAVEGSRGASNNPVKTAVIPVAGDGTRQFPVSMPFQKNLAPVVNKSLIAYAVEEAIAAGCEKIILIHGPEDRKQYKRAFGEGLSSSLEAKLPEKPELAEIVNYYRSLGAQIEYKTQDKPLGLGHAILQAKRSITEPGPLLVILPDDLILTGLETKTASEMVADYKGGLAVAAMEVDDQAIKSYGAFVPVSENYNLDKGPVRASGMVEKPDPSEAPSNMAAIGRYILPSSIMETLENTPKGAGGEIQLTDAIDTMVKEGVPLYASPFSGERFDCGNQTGYTQACMHVSMALTDPAEIFQRLKKVHPDFISGNPDALKMDDPSA